MSGSTLLAKGDPGPDDRILASWNRSLQVPTLPGRSQVHALRLPQPPPGATRRQLAAPQPAPGQWALRGTPELVVHGRLQRTARFDLRTPTPRRPRAAKIAPSQRFKRTMSAPRGPRGRLPNRPPVDVEPTRLAALLELTDFVRQFVRHAGNFRRVMDTREGNQPWDYGLAQEGRRWAGICDRRRRL